MNTDPNLPPRGRGWRVSFAVVALAVGVATLGGCGGGKDADALPAYTGSPTTSASPTPAPEEAAEAAMWAFYDTLRSLHQAASADRASLAKVATGDAFKAELKELRHYDKSNMPDNGKVKVSLLETKQSGENYVFRTCNDKRKLRWREPDGGWSPTFVVNITEDRITVMPTASGWIVAEREIIFSGGCNK